MTPLKLEVILFTGSYYRKASGKRLSLLSTSDKKNPRVIACYIIMSMNLTQTYISYNSIQVISFLSQKWYWSWLGKWIHSEMNLWLPIIYYESMQQHNKVTSRDRSAKHIGTRTNYNLKLDHANDQLWRTCIASGPRVAGVLCSNGFKRPCHMTKLHVCNLIGSPGSWTIESGKIGNGLKCARSFSLCSDTSSFAIHLKLIRN